ncbi:glutathione hydrolase-like YwrD proenzyme isoform X2 [Emydura macquarii macquarii]|uniref:glutathione hydrolase-like YwrD proenzyme isoform X2 n=1 Tax=Emydura macquarii macquarii TaxID=1129001 RepID=UPI00352BC048
MSELKFCSRRSPVICTSGCVASNQLLATNIGLDILKSGGNAADAAVAVAAALNVTEPCSTGIGGDCFCLYYEANTKQVHGLNGSGRSPGALTIELLKVQGFNETKLLPPFHAHNITVPGAAAGWCDAVSLYGSKKLSMGQILQPAIQLAEKGFPVSEITAYHWKRGAHLLQAPENKHGNELLIHGEAPHHGEVFCNPFLANTFKELAKSGKKGFYEGCVAEAIIETVQRNGGVMDLEDLKSHVTEEVKPIFTNYKGVNVWEIPPNGQGITALLALNILDNFNIKAMGHNTADYLHVLIEALKLSFSDTFWFCADPDKVPVPTKELLSKTYAKGRSELINLQRASDKYNYGNLLPVGSDTVYFTVVDTQGNACSFINSNYMGFGTGLVPEGCGFTLQVLLNMLTFGMNPQQALDAARFCLDYSTEEGKWHLLLEDGISQAVAEDLRARHHCSQWPITGHNRSLFGRGQIITKGDWWKSWDSLSSKSSHNVLWAGSDPRGDGCAVGY